MQSEAVI